MIIMESCIGIKNWFETNKQSVNWNVPNQWLIAEQIKSYYSALRLLLTRSARMGDTSMEEIMSIK